MPSGITWANVDPDLYCHMAWLIQQCVKMVHGWFASIYCKREMELVVPLVLAALHGDVIKWKNFPCYWPFMRGIHRSLVVSLHKDQWRRTLMFSLICAGTNGWSNNRSTGDLRRHHAHYNVILIKRPYWITSWDHGLTSPRKVGSN